ncbi:MAG: type 2 isopentenyl-diphosphate Delta-isomerase [Myxococcales bacterium]|nr:type 2 isopentenyl-diphosphate Delta-isomerase [Myxococcales bacterium]
MPSQADRSYPEPTSDIGARKADHVDLCEGDEVSFRSTTTLLECVNLLHQSLPELSAAEVSTEVELLGRRLGAPIVIAAMTGGHERAAAINRSLATIAQERGYGFGLGSQRAMQRDRAMEWTYRVREWAPDVLLLGNIGVVQARETATRDLESLVRDVGADALCVHLNPAMELIQSDGDRDFRGCVQTLERLCNELPFPIIAKETGNGLSPQTVQKLARAGVQYVDTSGAGGTSWVGVETLRAEGMGRSTGNRLWDWGIPTAPSIHYAVSASLTTIATGGIRSGLDVARAIALGARASGIARPLLQALARRGEDGVRVYLDEVAHELRSVMLLTGARTVEDLQQAPRIISGELENWITALQVSA